MGAAAGQAVGAAEGDRGAGAAQDRGDPGEVQRGGGPDRLLLHVRRGQPRAHFQVLQGDQLTVLNNFFIVTFNNVNISFKGERCKYINKQVAICALNKQLHLISTSKYEFMF